MNDFIATPAKDYSKISKPTKHDKERAKLKAAKTISDYSTIELIGYIMWRNRFLILLFTNIVTMILLLKELY